MNQLNKVIVTGGCGFIGSTLVDKLVEMQYEVHVIDDLSAESNDQFYYNNLAHYHNLSICDKSIEKVFPNVQCIFHLAAESRIKSCIDNPEKAATTNILGTLNLLELCKKHNVKRFIYSSTSAVYGLNCDLPTDENAKVTCLNQYSTTKYCGEEIIKLYNRMYDIDSCIFRYFNVFGERSPTKGIYAPVIGIFLKQFKNNKELTIVGDGEQRRDFVHVKDVVRANILAMEFNENIGSNVFNIGLGRNYSINKIARLISDKCIHIDPRIGEVRHNLADISKISQILGWCPEIDVIEWLKSQL